MPLYFDRVIIEAWRNNEFMLKFAKDDYLKYTTKSLKKKKNQTAVQLS